MGMRSSSKPSELSQFSGFGKQEGTAKVVGARFKVIQHVKGEASGGGLTTPFLALQLDEVYVDPATMKPVDPSLAPEQVNFPVCWGDKESLEAKLRFWPAHGKSADDDDLTDIGVSDIDGEEKLKLVEIDAEGNTLVSVDGATPYANSEYGVFISGLGKKAFKEEILAKSFAPDLIGLVYAFDTKEKKVVLERLGIKYTPSTRKDKKGNPVPDVCRDITNIHVRPYEKGAKSGTATVSKANGKADAKTVAAAVEPEGGMFTDTEVEAIKQAVGALKGNLTRKDFKAKVGLHIVKNKAIENGSKIGSGVSNKIGKLDDDGWTAMSLEVGGVFEVEGDQVTIA